MTDILFYHLQNQPLERVLPVLLEKSVERGWKVVVEATSPERVEALDALLEKRLPGFGELFRMLSYEEIGAAAMLSRATAGVFGGTLIFCLPGSTAAVRLALEKLIIPQAAHLVWETVRS